VKSFLIVLFFSIQILADNNIVQVPDSCIENKKSPCLIKAKTNVQLTWGNQVDLELSKEALVEVQESENSLRFDVLSGFARLQSKDKDKQNYKIFGFEVITNQVQYVSAQRGQVEVFDSQSLDLKTFVQEKNLKSSERIFVLHKSEFLNRAELVRYLARFYPDLKSIKSALSKLSVSYQKKLTSESVRQAEFLKKKQDREIASIELEEKRRIAEQIQQEKDRKRSRELFFMRTFKQ
jgi:hypothetical protein